jgi:hypothetical protein
MTVTWNEGEIARLTTIGPAEAHARASQLAAGIAAAKVGSGGPLARDVATPKHLGPMHAQVGSDLVYANIQNRGGTIRPKRAKRLLIHDKSGKIVASASKVTIPGKHYLDAAASSFAALFMAELRRVTPG